MLMLKLYTFQHCSYTYIKHMAIESQVCFDRWPFTNPVKPRRSTTGTVEPVSSIDKDVCSAKLLPTTVQEHPMDCVCFCHLLKIQHCCMCPSGRYNLPPPVHPPLLYTYPTPPSCPLPYTYMPLVILQQLPKVKKLLKYSSAT